MLVGYVSDERYVAIADVTIEFERDGETVACVHSTARGKVIAEIEPGDYRVTLGTGMPPVPIGELEKILERNSLELLGLE